MRTSSRSIWAWAVSSFRSRSASRNRLSSSADPMRSSISCSFRLALLMHSCSLRFRSISSCFRLSMCAFLCSSRCSRATFHVAARALRAASSTSRASSAFLRASAICSCNIWTRRIYLRKWSNRPTTSSFVPDTHHLQHTHMNPTFPCDSSIETVYWCM